MSKNKRLALAVNQCCEIHLRLYFQIDRWCRSPIGTADHGHKLFDLTPLICFAAGSNCVLDTVPDVITKYFFFNPSERRSDSRNLRDNVDAIPVLLYHSREPADLTFNPRQAFGA
jgi:hypothetical protein